jgi:hypothetical protein
MRFYYATFLWWNGGGGMHQWNAHRHHHSRMYRIWYKLSHIVLPSRQQVRCFLALAFVNNWQFHSLDRMTKQIQSFQESQSLPPSDNSSFLPWNSHTTFVDLKPILQVSYFAGNYMELYSLRARPGTARALSLSSPNHPFCWYLFLTVVNICYNRTLLLVGTTVHDLLNSCSLGIIGTTILYSCKRLANDFTTQRATVAPVIIKRHAKRQKSCQFCLHVSLNNTRT